MLDSNCLFSGFGRRQKPLERRPPGAVPEAESSCWVPRNKELGVCAEGQAPSCPDPGVGVRGACLSSAAEAARTFAQLHDLLGLSVYVGRGGRGLGAGQRGSQAAVGEVLEDTCAQARPRPFRPVCL